MSFTLRPTTSETRMRPFNSSRKPLGKDMGESRSGCAQGRSFCHPPTCEASRTGRDSSGQLLFYDGACFGEVHLAGMAFFEFAHHAAHVLDAGGTRLGNHGLDGGSRLGFRELLRHEALDDRDFLV